MAHQKKPLYARGNRDTWCLKHGLLTYLIRNKDVPLGVRDHYGHVEGASQIDEVHRAVLVNYAKTGGLLANMSQHTAIGVVSGFSMCKGASGLYQLRIRGKVRAKTSWKVWVTFPSWFAINFMVSCNCSVRDDDNEGWEPYPASATVKHVSHLSNRYLFRLRFESEWGCPREDVEWTVVLDVDSSNAIRPGRDGENNSNEPNN